VWGYVILAVIAASLLLALVVTQWTSRNEPGDASDAHHQAAVDRYRRGGGDGGISGPQG